MAVRRSVKYIGMFDYELTDHFVLQLSFEKPFLNVRALQLDEYRASLNNIFAILSAMPAVQMISSGIFEMPEIGNAIAGSGWIDMLYNRFGGAFHRNIQYWRLHFETIIVEGSMSIEYVDVDMSVHYSVLYASVLAVLCPNFKGIWVPSDFTDEYAEGIKEQMNELPFSNYYHLVGRLLRTRGSSDASPSKSDL
ncbi:hypothetical protein LPJ59_004174 [Coemansia sp. RSA 2399]|nr:hypothetical protein LPJ59_004174 [Coemansia sp. RSA 2399]